MDREYLPAAIVFLLVAFFLLLPPKYDPTIRLREWLNKRKK
jgi:hypothetical protein